MEVLVGVAEPWMMERGQKGRRNGLHGCKGKRDSELLLKLPL
jgi:hypothetical protein